MADNPAGDDPKTKQILIVDDDKDISDLVSLLVKTAGFQLVTAASGEEAIAKFAVKRPDAIVLDLIMPGCGGLGVLKHLRSYKDQPPPVIVITAYQNRHPAVNEALQDPNVVQCLGKPLDHNMLIGALHRFTNTVPANKGV